MQKDITYYCIYYAIFCYSNEKYVIQIDMMHTTVLLSFLLASDKLEGGLPTHSQQHILMSRFFGVWLEFQIMKGQGDHYIQEIAEKILRKDEPSTLHNECTWVGVHCTDTVATSLTVSSSQCSVNIIWIPNSVRFINIRETSTHAALYYFKAGILLTKKHILPIER